MKINTIIVAKNNVDPKQNICLQVTDTGQEPVQDDLIEVDYETLSAAEKTQYDDCMAMIESKIPA